MTFRRWTLTVGLLGVTAALLWTAPAIAHHSSAPFYDSTKRVETQGTVTKFLFKNPHSFLYFEADESGKKVEWQIELGAASGLARTGWTPETLKPGTVIKASGQPSRAEGHPRNAASAIPR